MTSSKPNYLPKTPSPNVITLGIKVSTYKFGEDKIQYIAQSVANPPHSNKTGKVTGTKVWM